jgi:hypothetical protein
MAIKIYDLLYWKLNTNFAMNKEKKGMKNRLKLNIIIDLAMLLAMALTSISGIIIKSKAIRTAIYGSRRLWSDIHLWAGVAVIVLLVVHIVLHWQVVDGFFKKHIENKIARIALYVVLLVLLLLSTIPWIFVL